VEVVRGAGNGDAVLAATSTLPGTVSPAPASAPPVHPDDVRRKRRPLRPLRNAFGQAGEMVYLTGVLAKSAVTRPRGYWGDVRDQMYSTLRLCWLPMIISTTAFGFGAPGLQALNLYSLFGVPERLGSFFIMASVRGFAPWINAMMVAGVMGTAITVEFGARRVREELDAMEVLGVDPVRTLVLPRVIALFVMTGLLDLVALSFGVVGGFLASVFVGGASPGAFVDNFFANATVPDLWGSVLKTAIFGLIIGIVCCYKGLRAEGGPAGVGRAVNQAVVVSFAGIWIFNYVFTTILLGVNPSMQIFK